MYGLVDNGCAQVNQFISKYMSDSYKPMFYQMIMPTDISPDEIVELIKTKFDVEKFERSNKEMVLHLDHRIKKNKVKTGTFKPSKRDTVLKP